MARGVNYAQLKQLLAQQKNESKAPAAKPVVKIPPKLMSVKLAPKNAKGAVIAALADAERKTRPPEELIKQTAHKEMLDSKKDQAPVLKSRFSRLVNHDFPFDESQLVAIEGLAIQQYGCLMGAAGTGKTTCTKALIDRLQDSVSTVDIARYHNADAEESTDVAAIALCAYTGKASQQIKNNFPEDWHENIMTIHRMLGFKPEWYDDIDIESGQPKKKVRFIPSYNAMYKLPWDIIVIDEAGMLGIELWHQLLDACTEDTRIIMIGDINQLPPVQGHSIFGYALTKWPSYELTHIHRQKGEHNPIVDNAWRILKGKLPEERPGFKMIKVDGEPAQAARQFRAALIKLAAAGIYDPITDTALTATNGTPGQKGEQLGQLPMNEFLAIQFNPDAKRYLIDAGRERRGFAPGDKVMVTKNDHMRGLTNGMTGVISEIQFNEQYQGDPAAVGEVADVQKLISKHRATFNLEEMMESLTQAQIVEKEKEQHRGHASHRITVQFDGHEHSFESFSEVASLQLAYVVTCHKSQGSEYRTVIIMVHDTHKSMMYREWLYTAVTRASKYVILLYTDNAISGAVRKQKITGATMKQKALQFIKLAGNPLKRPPRLPNEENFDARAND